MSLQQKVNYIQAIEKLKEVIKRHKQGIIKAEQLIKTLQEEIEALEFKES